MAACDAGPGAPRGEPPAPPEPARPVEVATVHLAPAPPPPPPTPTALALGEDTTCVTRSDGRTTCRGALELPGVDLVGRLEVTDNDVCARSPPQARCLHHGADREIATPFVEVVRGPGAPCARDAEGGVWCFRPETLDEASAELLPVPLPAAATALGADGSRLYARLADGTLWTWPAGYGAPPEPTRLAEGVATIDSQPWTRLCAALPEVVRCWATGRAERPRPVAGARALAVGRAHVCALTDRVTCWGANDAGQASPPSLAAPAALDAGDDHTCAIDGEVVRCWGADDHHQSSGWTQAG